MKSFNIIFLATILSVEAALDVNRSLRPYATLMEDGTVRDTEEVVQAKAKHEAARASIIAKLARIQEEEDEDDDGTFPEAAASELHETHRGPKSLVTVDRNGRVKSIRDVGRATVAHVDPVHYTGYQPFYGEHSEFVYLTPIHFASQLLGIGGNLFYSPEVERVRRRACTCS